jgi:hypothetical protein
MWNLGNRKSFLLAPRRRTARVKNAQVRIQAALVWEAAAIDK